MIVGWVDADGNGQLIDTWSDNQEQPLGDTESNVVLLEATEQGGATNIKFERLIDTGDAAQDVAVRTGAVLLQWGTATDKVSRSLLPSACLSFFLSLSLSLSLPLSHASTAAAGKVRPRSEWLVLSQALVAGTGRKGPARLSQHRLGPVRVAAALPPADRQPRAVQHHAGAPARRRTGALHSMLVLRRTRQ